MCQFNPPIRSCHPVSLSISFRLIAHFLVFPIQCASYNTMYYVIRIHQMALVLLVVVIDSPSFSIQTCSNQFLIVSPIRFYSFVRCYVLSFFQFFLNWRLWFPLNANTLLIIMHSFSFQYSVPFCETPPPRLPPLPPPLSSLKLYLLRTMFFNFLFFIFYCWSNVLNIKPLILSSVVVVGKHTNYYACGREPVSYFATSLAQLYQGNTENFNT